MASLTCVSRKNFLGAILGRGGRVFYKSISTTEKNKESSEACPPPPPEAIYKKIPDFSKPLENKNWLSYGFDEEDKYEDRFMFHLFNFCFCTIILGGTIFIYIYYPDKSRNDWCRREAFVRLYEREQLGLPAIDPNYVDPEKINLPPDEEIGRNDIII